MSAINYINKKVPEYKFLLLVVKSTFGPCFADLWQSCQTHVSLLALGLKSDWPLLWIWEENRSRRLYELAGVKLDVEARQFSSYAHCSMNMGRSSMYVVCSTTWGFSTRSGAAAGEKKV